MFSIILTLAYTHVWYFLPFINLEKHVYISTVLSVKSVKIHFFFFYYSNIFSKKLSSHLSWMRVTHRILIELIATGQLKPPIILQYYPRQLRHNQQNVTT